MSMFQKFIGGLLFVCLVLAVGLTVLNSGKPSCSLMSVRGVGTDGTNAYFQTWGGGTFQYDWVKESWVESHAPQGVPFFDSQVGISDGPHKGTIINPDDDQIGIWLGNKYTSKCN